MTRLLLSPALKEIRSRNAGIASAYRALAKRLPPGPVCKLASSLAEQRLDLGKTLAEVSDDHSLAEVEVEFDFDPVGLDGEAAVIGAAVDPAGFLKKVTEAEEADHELLAALAGALLPASLDFAERLATEAAAARKRAMWAQNHLDLLGMGS